MFAPRFDLGTVFSKARSAEEAGNWNEALSVYQAALEQCRALGAPAVAELLRKIGLVCFHRGHTGAALAHYQSALACYRATGDEIGAARTLDNIGRARLHLREFQRAEAAFDAALAAADARRAAEIVGAVQLNRADLYRHQNRFDDARACCDQAFEIFGQLGSTLGLSETFRRYGVLYRESGKLHLAEAHLSSMVELARRANHPLLQADAERERALVHHEQDRRMEAFASLNRAYRLAADLSAGRELVAVASQLDLIEQSYLHIGKAWGESAETSSLCTAGHCERVADYTNRLAAAVGLVGRELNWIRLGALLHDIGKGGVAPRILRNTDGLDQREWEELRAHTTVGDRMVAELEFPYDLRPMVRSHHERWDGAGYPDGLSGENIPLSARMLCIADVYDALTTDRSYRPAFSQDEALAIMQGEAGRLLDPQLFQIFRAVMTDGEEANRQPARQA